MMSDRSCRLKFCSESAEPATDFCEHHAGVYATWTEVGTTAWETFAYLIDKMEENNAADIVEEIRSDYEGL